MFRHKLIDRNQAHFSLRKLSIGLASVLLSTSLYFLSTDLQTVNADTVDPNTTQQVTESAEDNTTSNPANTTNVDESNKNETPETPNITTSDNLEQHNHNKDVNLDNPETETATDSNQDINTSSTNTNQSADNITKPKEPDTSADNSQNNWYNYNKETNTLVIQGNKTFTNPKELFGLYDQYGANVKHINIADKTIIIGKARLLFSSLPELVDITGLENLDTSQVTDMSYMFADSSKLNSIDVSKFDTSKVTNMAYMFSGIATPEIDVSHFDLSNVTDMSCMYDSSAVVKVDFSNHLAPKLETMNAMFEGCQNLTNVNLSNFVTGRNTDLGILFSDCENLLEVNFDGFETNHPDLNPNNEGNTTTDMTSMFESCFKLQNLDFSKAIIRNVSSAGMLCYDCHSLRNVDISGIDLTGEDAQVYDMFTGVRHLHSLTLGPKSIVADQFGGNINLESLGTWFNKGNGTIRQPQGNKAWTSEQFMENYQHETDADTYVRLFDFNIRFVDQDNNNQAIADVEPIVMAVPSLSPEGTDLHKPYFTIQQTNKMKAIVDKLVAQGYELVTDPFADSTALHPEMSQINIDYVFKQQSDDKEETLDKEYTVHFVDDQGNQLAPDHVQKVHFTRKVKVSRVTGKVMDDTIPWQTNSKYYEDVTIPTISGYKPKSKTANGSVIKNNQITNVKIALGVDNVDNVVYEKIAEDSSSIGSDNTDNSSANHDNSNNSADHNSSNNNTSADNNGVGADTSVNDHNTTITPTKPIDNSHGAISGHHTSEGAPITASHTSSHKHLSIHNGINKLANKVVSVASKKQPAYANKQISNKQATLPQTGSNQSTAANLIAIMLGLLLIIGSLIPNFKKDNK